MNVEEHALPEYAKQFMESLPTKEGTSAYIVNLFGDLGAGKTAFVQAVSKELGITEAVTSPTFVIMRRYDLHHPRFKQLIHIDAYRLNPSDPDTIGWASYREDPRNLVFIEWPEHMPGGTPKEAYNLQLTVIGEHERKIEEKTI